MHLQGDGIAARCCELLLNQAGIGINFERHSRAAVPAVMLGHSAAALIRDIFGDDGLFRDAPKICQRVVAWKKDVAPAILLHSGVVISGQALLESLPPVMGSATPSNLDWTIHAARPLPLGTVHHSFGTRLACALRVRLRANAQAETCWIESLRLGWLFLVAESSEAGWLLSVGESADILLGVSSLVASQVEQCGSGTGMFSAHPNIAAPLGADGWIACGTAAMAFDPICGDGTAHAVREGILASAVIRAIVCGGNAVELIRHYDARLTAGFQRHLELCREFYSSGYGGPWWDRELELTEQGIAWCRAKLHAHGAFRYRLHGFELERLVT